jgi:NitT/TauT family transport system ATP-binding protein
MMLNINLRAKRFENGCLAIKDLQFSAWAGEFIAIVGPSGAGKSTLLNLIAGLDAAFEGDIQWQPPVASTAANANKPPQAPRLGYLFQESRLMPWLTVRQNLTLVCPTLGEAALAQWLDRVGLSGCANLFPGQLSGGMQRRVALLRAFIVEPELLLMDEPFQSLDAPTAQQLRALLHALWSQRQPTVLFVTHDLREALSLAQRILFLSPSPARIVSEHKVAWRGLCSTDDPAVNADYAALLSQYPQLLQGLHNPDNAITK